MYRPSCLAMLARVLTEQHTWSRQASECLLLNLLEQMNFNYA